VNIEIKVHHVSVLCRYVTWQAVCLERLSTNAAGQESYELKHLFRDGTTHILFTPEDFLARWQRWYRDPCLI
jgi:hypothetical protein